MKAIKIILLFTISIIGILYGLGEMVNKKYNVDELYWQAEGKTNTEAQKQSRIKQLDERGEYYTLKYSVSFTISIIAFIFGTIYLIKTIKQK